MSRKIFSLILTAVLLLSACGANTPAAQNSGPQELTIAMPYIPSVQFAYLYVADKKGYYADEGISLKFDYNYETDVVQRIAQGSVHFGLSSGDSVLLARSQGMPIVSVATISQHFPVVFYSKAEHNITTVADLKGRKIGIPGRFGASYIGLLALLYSNGMQEQDLDIHEVGFGQLAALIEDQIEVASGYGNNEPIQLAQQGIKTNVINIADFYPLASDGVITNEDMISKNPDLVQKFVRATLKGMRDTIDNPEEAFDTALTYIPEAQNSDLSLQRQVLDATITYWQSDLTVSNGLGFANADNWQATHTFLRDSNLLKQDVDTSKAFTNQFIK
jgi:NitT/TauT family transport system substrate-binding protein